MKWFLNNNARCKIITIKKTVNKQLKQRKIFFVNKKKKI